MSLRLFVRYRTICQRPDSRPQPIRDAGLAAGARLRFKLRSRSQRRAEREQLVELGRIVARTVGRGDEDLPALFCETTALCDGNDDAQANRRRSFFTSRCVYHEGHGNILSRKARCGARAISVPACESGEVSGTSLHGRSVEEMFQRLLSRQVGRAMRAEAVFP
jgi:hypothetical protein